MGLFDGVPGGDLADDLGDTTDDVVGGAVEATLDNDVVSVQDAAQGGLGLAYDAGAAISGSGGQKSGSEVATEIGALTNSAFSNADERLDDTPLDNPATDVAVLAGDAFVRDPAESFLGITTGIDATTPGGGSEFEADALDAANLLLTGAGIKAGKAGVGALRGGSGLSNLTGRLGTTLGLRGADDAATVADDALPAGDNAPALPAPQASDDALQTTDDTPALSPGATDDTGGTADDALDVFNTSGAGASDDSLSIFDDTAQASDGAVQAGDDTAQVTDDVAQAGDDAASQSGSSRLLQSIRGGDNAAAAADDTAQAGDDVLQASDDTAQVADDAAQAGDDVAQTADDSPGLFSRFASTTTGKAVLGGGALVAGGAGATALLGGGGPDDVPDEAVVEDENGNQYRITAQGELPANDQYEDGARLYGIRPVGEVTNDGFWIVLGLTSSGDVQLIDESGTERTASITAEEFRAAQGGAA